MRQLVLPFDTPFVKLVTRVHRTSVRPLRSMTQMDDMIRIARAFQEECDPDAEFDEISVYTITKDFIEMPTHNWTECWHAYNSEGRAVGFLLASIGQSFYSLDKTARQDLWYVLPQYRGGPATLKLLHTFEQWAKDKGASSIVTGSTNAVNIRLAEKTASTLTKLGYGRIGSVHVKEIANG